MRTLVPVAADSELFNDYGPLPRSDLLRRYGYITPNYAQYDVVEVSSPLIVDIAGKNLSAEDKKARVDYLLDEGILEDSFDLDCSFEVPEELAVIVRTMLLPREEFQASKDKGEVPKPGFTEEVGLVLVAALEARLTDYPTSVQEDQKLLAENRVVGGRERAGLEVRVGEKMILEGTLRDIRRRIQKKRERPDKTSHRKRARAY
jgi:SET domain-containing protein 6